MGSVLASIAASPCNYKVLCRFAAKANIDATPNFRVHARGFEIRRASRLCHGHGGVTIGSQAASIITVINTVVNANISTRTSSTRSDLGGDMGTAVPKPNSHSRC
jgi:hypothetical protein